MKYDGSADWRIGGQMTLFLIIPALKFALSSELPVTDYLNFTDLIFVWATLIVSFGLILEYLVIIIFYQMILIYSVYQNR